MQGVGPVETWTPFPLRRGLVHPPPPGEGAVQGLHLWPLPSSLTEEGAPGLLPRGCTQSDASSAPFPPVNGDNESCGWARAFHLSPTCGSSWGRFHGPATLSRARVAWGPRKAQTFLGDSRLSHTGSRAGLSVGRRCPLLESLGAATAVTVWVAGEGRTGP